MHLLLFIFYSIIGCYAITRIPFFRHSGIRPALLLLYLGLRVATGCLHNMIAYRYYPNHGDIWLFFNESFITRHELFTDLRTFWANNSTLAYLQHNLIGFMHVLLNFLSFDNMYINTLFFSFFTLGGAIAFFRVFTSWFSKDWLSACCILLLPSTLFWTSCIDTEGILFILLGFFFFHLTRLFPPGSHPGKSIPNPDFGREHLSGEPRPHPTPASSTRSVLLASFLFALAVFFRPAILVGLLPAILCWILAAKKRSPKNHRDESHRSGSLPRRGPKTLLLTSIAALLLLASFSFFTPIFTPILRYLSARQHEFQVLTGNSRIYLPVLEPTWSSFARIFPPALFNGFFQPLPGSGGQAIYGAFSLELTLIWLILVLSIYRYFTRSPTGKSSPSPAFYFGLSCLLFSVLGMLLIGYIIPFVGSIIRYRSIYLPFLLAPFLHNLRNTRLPAALNKWLSTYFSAIH
ncbi:MAG TPA: hypothetical protein VNS58_08845 [Puia sp.]|nr:hypothetical protein [Puia sp.]